MFLVFLCLWDYVTGSKLHYGVPVVESSLLDVAVLAV